jgi:hypothetical protein
LEGRTQRRKLTCALSSSFSVNRQQTSLPCIFPHSRHLSLGISNCKVEISEHLLEEDENCLILSKVETHLCWTTPLTIDVSLDVLNLSFAANKWNVFIKLVMKRKRTSLWAPKHFPQCSCKDKDTDVPLLCFWCWAMNAGKGSGRLQEELSSSLWSSLCALQEPHNALQCNACP